MLNRSYQSINMKGESNNTKLWKFMRAQSTFERREENTMVR